jgi:aminopeptidase N
MGEKSLQFALSAYQTYTELFGAYPYKQLSIAQTDFFIGGMEYPNLVFISQDFYTTEGLHTLEHVIAHEVAHQWWYGVIGNDEVSCAWLDEGLTHYSTMLYYEKHKDPSTFKTYFKYYLKNGYRFALDASKKKYENLSLKIDRPLYKFEDAAVYDMLCYDKSAMMMHSLREQMGDEAFFKSLQEFYKDYLFTNETKEDFSSSLSKNSTLPINSIVDSWLNDKVIIN